MKSGLDLGLGFEINVLVLMKKSEYFRELYE